MEQRPARTESTLEAMGERLAALERRITAIEERLEGSDLVPSRGESWEPSFLSRSDSDAADSGWSNLVPLLGRSLLILGGAYLLRALTELETVPDALGVAIGLAYGALWLAAAGRSESRSAAFYVFVGALVGYPLIWEAATRFQILGAAGSAIATVLLTAAILWLAGRRQLRSVGWLATLAGPITCLALVSAGDAPAMPLAALVTIGIGILWIAYLRSWKELAWISAGWVDFGLVILLVARLGDRMEVSVAATVTLLLGFFAAYVISFGLRTLLQGRDVGLFEVVQTVAATALGFEGAIRVSSAAGWEIGPLGLAGIAVGAAAYGVAFSPGVRAERRRNFLFYSSLGLLLVLVGSHLLLADLAATVVWTAIAVGCAWLSGRLRRVTLSLHSAVYVVAALTVSGAARAAGEALFLPDPPTWASFGGGGVVVLAAAVACLALPAARESPSWGTWARVPRFVLWLAAAWIVAGGLCWLAAPAIAGGGASFDDAALAALRTATLALLAIACAALGRYQRLSEAAWIVYPLLAVVGAKVLLVDLPGGRPVTQFASLALLGIALMVAARLRKAPASAARQS